MDIEEHGAARVGRIRHMRTTTDEIPRQKAVYRAEADFAAFSAIMQIQMIKQPAQLAAGKICIRHQSRRLPDVFFQPFFTQPGHNRRSPGGALPDDRIVQRSACFSIPQERGFALVGHADRRNAVQRSAGNANHFTQRIDLRIEDGCRSCSTQPGCG